MTTYEICVSMIAFVAFITIAVLIMRGKMK